MTDVLIASDDDIEEERPAPRKVMAAALIGWAGFGLWALLREEPPSLWGLSTFVGHTLLFVFPAVCVFLVATRTGQGRFRRAMLAMLALLGVALFSEWLQSVVTPNRKAQFGDLLGDAVGIAIGGAVAFCLLALLRRADRANHVGAVVSLIALVVAVVLVGLNSEAVQLRAVCGDQFLESAGTEGDPILMLGPEDVVAASSGLRCNVMRSGAMSVFATVTPSSDESVGPTRIVTSSGGTEGNAFNFHLGQQRDQLSIRIRTGTAGTGQWELVPDVFSSAERVRVGIVIEDGSMDVWVDNEVRATFELNSASFAGWDRDYPILVGDEVGGGRMFDGDVDRVMIYDRSLLPAEVLELG